MGRNKVNKEQEKQIIEMYNNHVPRMDIAKSFNISKSLVRIILNRNGFLTRRQKFYKNVDEQQVLNLFNQGVGPTQIGKKFGVSAKPIRSVLKKYFPNLDEMFEGCAHPFKECKKMDRNGYLLVKIYKDDPYFDMADKKGYVSEHRHVMAKYLGRPLSKNESVHHIDGNGSNNNIDNLQLRFGSHGSGQCYECSICGSDKIEPVKIKDKNITKLISFERNQIII